MTTQNTTAADLYDDLTFDWLLQPTGERLRELCAAYPDHARALVDFAVTYRLIELAPEPPPLSADEEARLHETGLAVVRRVIDEAVRKRGGQLDAANPDHGGAQNTLGE